MRDVSFYRLADGMLTGARFSGPEDWVPANIPAGCGAIDGWHDAMSYRIDLATGAVVDWQPPKPSSDAYTDHEWNAQTRRWAPVETVAGKRRRLADRVNALRAQALSARRVTPSGIAYRIVNDRVNLETILTGRAALGVPPAMPTDWRDDDNVMHALDGPALAAFVGHMLPLGQAIFDRSWALKDAIDAADTHDELDAIDLTAGWPT